MNSYYSLPDDAWQYELTGMSEAGEHVAVVIRRFIDLVESSGDLVGAGEDQPHNGDRVDRGIG